MLSDKAKELFKKLKLDYSPVALKFTPIKPEGVSLTEAKMSLCQFVRETQKAGKKFCISVANEDCVGKMVLGMEPVPPIGASGQAGYDFGVFKTQGANARLYHMIPRMVPGAVNYVTFAPTDICDFDPDLVIFVADTEKADILMRATSYISGDLWESKTSSVVSCAWTYVYPYVSGKVNFCVTGMHHGMGRRKVYPAGLHIISVPYQKLDEVVQALDEMDWKLISFRDDPESKEELSRRMKHWGEMAAQLNSTFSLPENK
jgi:uncharacterized protein (DUF169 family)